MSLNAILEFVLEDFLSEKETIRALNGNGSTPFIDMVPNGPNESHVFTNSLYVPKMNPFDLVGI